MSKEIDDLVSQASKTLHNYVIWFAGIGSFMAVSASLFFYSYGFDAGLDYSVGVCQERIEQMQELESRE